MTTEQPERERMTEEKIDFTIRALDEVTISVDQKYMNRLADESTIENAKDTITQLRTDLAESKRAHDMAECMVEAAREHIQKIEADLAAMTERAERAEADTKTALGVVHNIAKERDTLRTQITLAEQQRDAAVEGLERISRGDVVFERTGNMLQDVTRAMTAACGLARDTLARIRELGEMEGE